MELTIGVIRGRAGLPLRIFLPEGTPYSFLRKYLKRPRRAPLADRFLAERARSVALRIAGTLETDWAARVDLMLETATGRLCFLECDVAPLIGPRSAFAASLAAAGVTRAEQWPPAAGEISRSRVGPEGAAATVVGVGALGVALPGSVRFREPLAHEIDVFPQHVQLACE